MQLFIANKNYSSWSLRPWVLLKQLGIAFDERLVPFGGADFTSFSPSGRVPCLVDGDTTVWDSLAITEYLAERCTASETAHSYLAVYASSEANLDPRRHWCFKASTRAQVRAFYAAGLATGGRDDGAPGLRADYHPHYYGAFLLDSCGNRVEAVYHHDHE